MKCRQTNNKSTYFAMGGLIATALLSGAVLSSAKIYADGDSSNDEIEVTLQPSCTMEGSGQTSHSATLNPGIYSGDSSSYTNGIGSSTLTVYCNDNNGFSIYAIGYTADTAGNNVLQGTSASGSATIASALYDSSSPTTSTWSMKVTAGRDSGDTTSPNNLTIDNSFNNFHIVPDDTAGYTRVAHKSANTDMTEGTGGATITTTYDAYISTTQPADTYTGKVKYVLVHPYSQNEATDPNKPTASDLLPTPPASCNNPIAGVTYMQDINSTNKSTILASLTEEAPYYIYDSRDNEPYCVSMLKDGNLWMLDNLRLDLTNSDTLANVTELTTNASSTTLGYLKGTTTGTASDQYATSAVSDWGTNQTFSNSSSYTDPLVAASGNCDSNSISGGLCANDPTIGKWTKDSLPPGDNNGHLGYYGNGSGKIGVYYNFCAVSAGSHCYDGDDYYGGNPPSSDATEDICPKNWRMPSNSEFEALAQEYHYSYSADEATRLAFQNKFSVTNSGFFINGSASHGFGESGGLWSASFDEGAFNDFDMSEGSGGYSYPNIGISLRCVPR